MTSEQRYWWKIALELKLRKCSGEAFQDFISTVMAMAYGSDFVRVRPFGSLGDKGCDGYLKSQELEPGAIMSALYEHITGIGAATPARQVAAQALLAYLFESCDIFESEQTEKRAQTK